MSILTAAAGEETQRAATREAPAACGPSSTDAKAALLMGGLILASGSGGGGGGRPHLAQPWPAVDEQRVGWVIGPIKQEAQWQLRAGAGGSGIRGWRASFSPHHILSSSLNGRPNQKGLRCAAPNLSVSSPSLFDGLPARIRARRRGPIQQGAIQCCGANPLVAPMAGGETGVFILVPATGPYVQQWCGAPVSVHAFVVLTLLSALCHLYRARCERESRLPTAADDMAVVDDFEGGNLSTAPGLKLRSFLRGVRSESNVLGGFDRCLLRSMGVSGVAPGVAGSSLARKLELAEPRTVNVSLEPGCRASNVTDIPARGGSSTSSGTDAEEELLWWAFAGLQSQADVVDANLQGPSSIAPPPPAPSTSHQDDETPRQQSSSYKASEIASRFIDPNNKSHVDTAAPIDSVKGAVSKFGGVLDWREKRKQGQEDESDMVSAVQEEVAEYHKRAVSAEAARSQALVELGRTASAADKRRLRLQRAQVEDTQARQEADLAGRRLEESQRAAVERAAAKAELDAVRARRAAALAELESMAKVRAAAVAEADAARKRAREAAAESQETGKAVEGLVAELIALKGELESSHAAHVAAEEKRLRLAVALEEDKSQWQMELEEAQQEAKRLRGELVAACEVEMKAEAASKLLANLKAELSACAAVQGGNDKPAAVSSEPRPKPKPKPMVVEKMHKELEDVKASVERAKDEAKCLRVAAASMRDVLEKEKAELAVVRRREGLSSASIHSLREELSRAASELAVAEAAAKADSGEGSKMAEQVGEARREAEEAKAKARSAREAVAKAREEAGVAKAAVATVEARLEAVAREILAATSSEEMAKATAAALVQQDGKPSKKSSSQQSNKAAADGGVTLTMEEYSELSRRARETEEVAGKRVMEAVKLIKEAKDAEVRSLEKLAKAGRQTEQRRQALEASTLEAEEAEFERMSAERELRQWHADHHGSPRAGLAEISVLGDRTAGGNNPHILSPRGGYMPRTTDLMMAAADADAAARQRKTTFFPRMVMFLARRRAQAWNGATAASPHLPAPTTTSPPSPPGWPSAAGFPLRAGLAAERKLPRERNPEQLKAKLEERERCWEEGGGALEAFSRVAAEELSSREGNRAWPPGQTSQPNLVKFPLSFPQLARHRQIPPIDCMAAAGKLLLVVAVLAVSLIAAADAHPCGHAQTLLISFSSVSRPNPDPTNPAPLTTTAVTVLRVRRLGPHQIRRAEALPTAAAASQSEAASSVQDRAKDILVVVSGLLFGFGCGALTAASMYLVWSLLASTCASGYDDVYSDDEDQLSDSESPKKAGYVIIHDAEDYGALAASGKN
ncbi:hypothetical protein HU200_001938 [Digitaria exilis]|uniref:Uncharacterized protein n=1 Tax=Digitaria exilis TaxID=1010633 RepID=A0A835KW57_9POAL|nr:hypothetical protein HU200_001938 [Digitaria exilis]